MYAMPKGQRLMWADTIGLMVALPVAITAVVASITMLLVAGTIASARLDGALALWTAEAECAIALPVWLALRAVDLMANGRRRRINRYRHAELHRFAVSLEAQPT